MDRPRIAIIDDNPHHRSMIKTILAPLDVDFFEIEAGKAALESIKHIDPHVILCRMTGRDFDGAAFCTKIKQSPGMNNIPVILIGSSETEEDVSQGFLCGATEYIDKSEARTKLLTAVNSHLCRRVTMNGKKILVVDDSRSMRLMLEEHLSRNGFVVTCAENGKEALEILWSEKSDVILCDVYMPEMNGLELCEILHSSQSLSDIPFVVMSTENDVENMRRMMCYGAAAFIIKPFNIEQLLVTLNNIFSYEFLILLKEKERLDTEQRLLLAGITSLVKALEARDQYTRGHSERVSLILAGMVKFNGGSFYEEERARIAGRLHDIGKIGIRDDVLLKAGRLTDEEFKHIKSHPTIGASILQNIPSISDIIPVVYSHHERMDGQGYPQRLKGFAIPLWARMTAVADTYDALTSDRPYRKGMTHEQALAIIDQATGPQLCPNCVRLFHAWCQKEKPENFHHS